MYLLFRSLWDRFRRNNGNTSPHLGSIAMLRQRICQSLLCLFLAITADCSVEAAVLITATESSGDVVFDGGGTLNLDAWTTSGGLSVSSILNPSAYLSLGSPGFESVNVYTPSLGSVFQGPTSIGPGNSIGFADSGSGDRLSIGFILGSPTIYVPNGYANNASLSTISTYAGETFDSLGIASGTYVWSWENGDGTAADSFTLQVVDAVPSPTSLTSIFSLLLLGLFRRVRLGRLAPKRSRR